MKLRLYLARFDRLVMCKVMEQDESLRSDGNTKTLAQVPANPYIRYIKSCNSPQLKVPDRVIFVRGDDDDEDLRAMYYQFGEKDSADAVCVDIVRLWATVNGMELCQIKVERTDTAGNPYEMEVNGTGNPNAEGVIIYTYEEVS